jgi:hypothetical protein
MNFLVRIVTALLSAIVIVLRKQNKPKASRSTTNIRSENPNYWKRKRKRKRLSTVLQ